MSKISLNLVSKLIAEYKNDIEIVEEHQISINIEANILLDIVKIVKEYGFNFLVDITAVEQEQISCVYHLMSLKTYEIIRIKARLNEKLEINSLTELWLSANVQEREVYDLFGINFIGHPNLKRILCPDNFIGHPLRKDFIVDTDRREEWTK